MENRQKVRIGGVALDLSEWPAGPAAAPASRSFLWVMRIALAVHAAQPAAIWNKVCGGVIWCSPACCRAGHPICAPAHHSDRSFCKKGRKLSDLSCARSCGSDPHGPWCQETTSMTLSRADSLLRPGCVSRSVRRTSPLLLDNVRCRSRWRAFSWPELK